MALVDDLRGSELFKDLSDEVLEKIASICQEETHNRGTTIFLEGAEAQNLYILKEGLVILRITPATNMERTIMVAAIKERGQVFGWSSLVEARQYTSTAVCMEDAKVLTIKGAELLALLEKMPAAGFLVMRRLASIASSRLRSTREQLIAALVPGLISHG